MVILYSKIYNLNYLGGCCWVTTGGAQVSLGELGNDTELSGIKSGSAT